MAEDEPADPSGLVKALNEAQGIPGGVIPGIAAAVSLPRRDYPHDGDELGAHKKIFDVPVSPPRGDYPDIDIDIGAHEKIIQDVASQQRWIMLTGPKLPYPVAMRLGLRHDGKICCTGLYIGAHAPGVADTEPVKITTRTLRHIRITELVKAITAESSRLQSLISYRGPRRQILDQLVPGTVPDLPPSWTRISGHALDYEHFVKVADEYKNARKSRPKAHMKELIRRLSAAQGLEPGDRIPESTVRHWVDGAIERKLLGPADTGKGADT